MRSAADCPVVLALAAQHSVVRWAAESVAVEDCPVVPEQAAPCSAAHSVAREPAVRSAAMEDFPDVPGRVAQRSASHLVARDWAEHPVAHLPPAQAVELWRGQGSPARLAYSAEPAQ